MGGLIMDVMARIFALAVLSASVFIIVAAFL